MPGACCLIDESCVVVGTYQECIALDGIWQGIGSQCGNVDCKSAGTGACCRSFFPCQDGLTRGQCAQLGGVRGPTGSICGPSFCSQFFGACCYSVLHPGIPPFEECEDSFFLEPDCVASGGRFHGVGTQCTDVDCADENPGACCLDDAMHTCVSETFPFLCTGLLGGTWQGEFTVCGGPGGINCSADPEPQDTGSCCLPNGTCVPDVTVLQCNAMAGSWRLDIPCPPDGPACPESGCREIQYGLGNEEYQVGDKTKSLNLCETAVGIFAKKPQGHLAFGDKLGYLGPFTNHDVRALFNADPFQDCAPSYGEFTTNIYGYVEPTICSKPSDSNTSRRLNVGSFIVAQEEFASEGVPAGYLHMVLPIDNPPWTEVQYHHNPRLCYGALSPEPFGGTPDGGGPGPGDDGDPG